MGPLKSPKHPQFTASIEPSPGFGLRLVPARNDLACPFHFITIPAIHVINLFAATLRIFLAGVFGLLGGTLFASDPVQQEWVARYNDTYDGVDGVYCMAVDKLGN